MCLFCGGVGGIWKKQGGSYSVSWPKGGAGSGRTCVGRSPRQSHSQVGLMFPVPVLLALLRNMS